MDILVLFSVFVSYLTLLFANCIFDKSLNLAYILLSILMLILAIFPDLIDSRIHQCFYYCIDNAKAIE